MKLKERYNHYTNIRLQIRNVLKEALMGEDYPETWNIEEFKKLNSFKDRIKYCSEHLEKISSGSSRIVYKIDDEKVLKLAKNKKGLAQNEIEIEYGNYYDISDIVAKVFESDENNLWVEMELAKKVTPNIFKNVVGISFEDYANGMRYHYYTNIKPSRYRFPSIKPENMDEMWENEFTYRMLSFMGDYDIPVGDLARLSTYGLTKRDGQDTIVMIDYGLTSDVYDNYYS
jgi:hypothetical protein